MTITTNPPERRDTEAKKIRSSRESAPHVERAAVPVRSFTLTILAVLAVFYTLRYAQEILLPIVLAILIAYSLDRLVRGVTKLGIPRSLAAGIVVFGLLGAVGYGVYSLRGQAMLVIEALPQATKKVREEIRELRERRAESPSAIGKLQEAAREIEKAAVEASTDTPAPTRVTPVRIEEPPFRATDFLWTGSVGLVGLAGEAVLLVFLVFFMLASGDMFKRKIMRIVGTKLSEKRITLETLNEMNSQIERFLLVQIVTSLIVGSLTALALWFFGVNQPLIWGIAAGVLNSIPYFGAFIVAGGLALIAFFQFDSIGMALQVAGVSVLINCLEGFLLTPTLMGRAARINGVAMFLSIVFWGWVWGVIGMIVAVPVMMVVKSVCERIDDLQPVSELLDDR